MFKDFLVGILGLIGTPIVIIVGLFLVTNWAKNEKFLGEYSGSLIKCYLKNEKDLLWNFGFRDL